MTAPNLKGINEKILANHGTNINHPNWKTNSSWIYILPKIPLQNCLLGRNELVSYRCSNAKERQGLGLEKQNQKTKPVKEKDLS